uniref:Uncharacterized protein n=1 Tax=Sonderella linearis TaxID=110477 RepID=A0A1Z1MMI3_9FLOR|nr:hypothetical protein [Sonderella linearis]ARW66961.1 hypothetical protein [Sonderella linearis]
MLPKLIFLLFILLHRLLYNFYIYIKSNYFSSLSY